MYNWLKINQFHIYALVGLALLGLIYCAPLLEGKVLVQTDIQQGQAMQHELMQYEAPDGSTPLWTNAMFGGMPATMIGGHLYNNNLLTHVIHWYNSVFPNPLNLILLYLLGAYLFFALLGFSPLLSLIASVAVAFSSYNFIIIEAGHGNKAIATALFFPIIAGILAAYRKKYLLSAFLISFFTGWEIRANHPQMTYYLLMAMFIFFMLQFWHDYKNQRLKDFFLAFSVILGATIVAVLINFSTLWSNYEFQKESTRGNTELSLNRNEPKTGLSEDYAYDWSQGIGECMTFFIPNAYGGASGGEALDETSATASALSAHQAPAEYLSRMNTYWGDKQFTSGPWYFGIVVLFLFIFSLFIVRGRFKWWLLSATLLSVVLSWGKNFRDFSNLFFYHLPLYNKFRAVESILVIAGFAVPLLAFIGVQSIIKKEREKAFLIRYLKITVYVVAGLCLITALFPGLFFNFQAPSDNQMPDWLRTAIRADRESLLKKDAFRSLIFIGSTAILLWAFIENRLKPTVVCAAIGFLVITDMWGVDKRYLKNSDFVTPTQLTTIREPRPVDEQILQDKTLDYRVYDASISTFNSASSSYFHKTIGGYNAAKLKRFQEIVDNQLAKNNIEVLNMLNTKYFIVPDSSKGAIVQLNPNALGNAWFVDSIRLVPGANAEMTALDHFNPKKTLIVDQRFQHFVSPIVGNRDTSAVIQLVSYRPDVLKYTYRSTTSQVAALSEIYYPKGWKAYLDGKLIPFFRGDYILRSIQLPLGNHTLVFKFLPESYVLGEKISLTGSLIFIILVVFLSFKSFRKKRDMRRPAPTPD